MAAADIDASLLDGARALAAAAGLNGEPRLTPIEGAANNRVFRLDADGRRALLKAYFRHPNDPRDRLGAEFAFSTFAWDAGLCALPRPLARDPERGLGLYEFVEGRRLAANEADAGAVAQALEFYRALNKKRDAPAARSLPEASEACFSLSAHLAAVGKRVARLKDLRPSDEAALRAADFARRELAAAWTVIEAAARKRASTEGLDAEALLPTDERRLSPSDFGFHNALIGSDGRLRFLDFEYAGWDDPARTVCDFFCQPAVPAPWDQFDAFTRGALADLPDPARHRLRADLLMPVYRVKWCCILLNDFLPVGEERRRFARRAPADVESRNLQLEKARGLLAAGGRA